MSTNNFIIPTNGGGGTSTGSLPTTQPTTPGHWLNNGVINFWDGTQNQNMDTVEGDLEGLDGTRIGDL